MRGGSPLPLSPCPALDCPTLGLQAPAQKGLLAAEQATPPPVAPELNAAGRAAAQRATAAGGAGVPAERVRWGCMHAARQQRGFASNTPRASRMQPSARWRRPPGLCQMPANAEHQAMPAQVMRLHAFGHGALLCVAGQHSAGGSTAFLSAARASGRRCQSAAVALPVAALLWPPSAASPGWWPRALRRLSSTTARCSCMCRRPLSRWLWRHLAAAQPWRGGGGPSGMGACCAAVAGGDVPAGECRCPCALSTAACVR